MSNEKKQMTVGDLKEKIVKQFEGKKLPTKFQVHITAMCMTIPTWGAIWHPLLIIQGLGLCIMMWNILCRKGPLF